jgi:hypothetical protein
MATGKSLPGRVWRKRPKSSTRRPVTAFHGENPASAGYGTRFASVMPKPPARRESAGVEGPLTDREDSRVTDKLWRSLRCWLGRPLRVEFDYQDATGRHHGCCYVRCLGGSEHRVRRALHNFGYRNIRIA